MATATISQIQLTNVAAGGDFLEIETVAGASRSITKQNFIGITISGTGTLALGGFTLTLTGNATVSGSHVGNVAGNISGNGTIATGGFTLTLGANSTINGSFVGSVAGAINGNISGGGTIATGGFTLTVAANSTINGSLVGNITGGGTLALGGFTATVPATGTIALKSGTPVAGRVATWLDANTVQDGGYLTADVVRKIGTPTANNLTSWNAANIVQDGGFAVADIARLSVNQTFAGQPTFSVGLVLSANIGVAPHMGLQGSSESLADQTAVLINNLGNNGVILISSSNRTGASALICFRANASPFCQILGQGSNLFEVSAAILLGTTGTNGKVTFSATATPGQCYLENRLGASLTYIIVRLT